MSRSERVRVSKAAADAVTRGHPWVFREQTTRLPAGQLTLLEDGRGRVVGWGLADEGPIAVRVLGRGEPEAELDRVLRVRMEAADVARLRLVEPGTDAMRVVAGAGDGLPGLVVDRYGEVAVLRLYSAAWEPHLEQVLAALRSLPWVGSVLRRLGVARVDGRQGTELLHGQAPAEALVVQEDGVKVLVRPYQGQKTGLFLDQREHRRLVGRWSSGREVANLFAYTGGFSVTAALGGAWRVTTVDLAPEAVDDARENFRLNGLDPDQHGFEVADAFSWEPRGGVDLLVVDPPSLTHGERSDSAARRAYSRLHRRLGPRVRRQGLLASSSCTARLSVRAWREALVEGLAPTGDWSWHWLSHEPVDHPVALAHPEAHYLKFGLLRRR